MDVMVALSIYWQNLKAFQEQHGRKPSEPEINAIYDEVC